MVPGFRPPSESVNSSGTRAGSSSPAPPGWSSGDAEAVAVAVAVGVAVAAGVAVALAVAVAVAVSGGATVGSSPPQPTTTEQTASISK
jgi:hypothetical protein